MRGDAAAWCRDAELGAQELRITFLKMRCALSLAVGVTARSSDPLLELTMAASASSRFLGRRFVDTFMYRNVVNASLRM